MSSPSRWRPNAFEVLAATLEPRRCCCQGLLRRRPWRLTNRERMRGVEDGAAVVAVRAVAKREGCCFTPRRQSSPFRVAVAPPVKRSGRRKRKLVEQRGKTAVDRASSRCQICSYFWFLESGQNATATGDGLLRNHAAIAGRTLPRSFKSRGGRKSRWGSPHLASAASVAENSRRVLGIGFWICVCIPCSEFAAASFCHSKLIMLLRKCVGQCFEAAFGFESR